MWKPSFAFASWFQQQTTRLLGACLFRRASTRIIERMWKRPSELCSECPGHPPHVGLAGVKLAEVSSQNGEGVFHLARITSFVLQTIDPRSQLGNTTFDGGDLLGHVKASGMVFQHDPSISQGGSEGTLAGLGGAHQGAN